MKYILKSSLLFLFIFLLFYPPYKSFTNIQPKNNIDLYEIYPGDTVNDVLYELFPTDFFNRVFIKFFFHSNEIIFQSGEYNLKDKSFLTIINDFKVGNTITYSFEIKEGSNIYDLELQVNNSKLINDCEYLKCLNSNFSNNEGLLLPNTYFYKKNDLASDIFIRSNIALNEFLNSLWDMKSENNVLSNQYEALILASIIEKEAGNNDEKELISSVFLKRLEIGMKLQADPTIIYGLLPNFDGDIKRKDILDRNNKYNTYVIDKFPPTPISFSSKSSIEAAILATPGEYLFFVADTPNSHVFSKTYKEHLKSVKEINKL